MSSKPQFRRVFECGHDEIVGPESPRFLHCYKCGTTGVVSERLLCTIPTCRNPATRVIRYNRPDTAEHYCDECKPLAACDESRVRTEHRLIDYQPDGGVSA